MDTLIVKWKVSLTNSLDFRVYDSQQNWKACSGLYIFAKPEKSYWIPLYIGKTEDLSERLPNHERLNEAVNLHGCTHLHVVALPAVDSLTLDLYESYMIQNYQPPMNIQKK